ncbi:hypoxanthine phosphoribosyltransferase [Gudongella oleilytica]|uniref:hypoxanthine phosphoribosyltransferase n=1 Tax=Gudongella oleilytica TaxID=1582259 RepID=UPI0023EA5129|nr:hypoxanthine phosphoribosyltransferase [Gudongella oleilytica]MDY0257526.1 hypoxanthine phosphoribosyltransferase [Gudongella oleilytica]HMM69240.1 hypoxanthine phosphoribosyltransferase [Gudongella oleilytica]
MKGETDLFEDKKEKVLISRDEISNRVREMGKEISKDYRGKDLVIVSLLRGSFIFTADLAREMDIPVEIEFMTTASYGHAEISSGRVEILQDIRGEIKGKSVLIVDDIIDSGHTLLKVMEHLEEREPASIKICVMLDKPSRRQVDLVPDYVGYEIPDVFIVGYGLNYGDHYRNIPYIFTFE